MSARELFLSFEGRLNRAPYWVGLIILGVLQIALAIGYLYLQGFPLDTLFEPGNDIAVSEANLVITLILAYPGLALNCKRLHDRNRSGWWGVLLYGLSIGSELIAVNGYAGTADNPSVAELVVLVPLFFIGIWFLVELGFLRGTVGPNRFGHDPLGGVADPNAQPGQPQQQPYQQAQQAHQPHVQGNVGNQDTLAGHAASPPVPSQPAAPHQPARIEWNNLFFGFQGRISRKHFWIGTIIVSLVGGVAAFIALAILGSTLEQNQTPELITLIPLGLVALAMMITSLAVSVKRLHDRNKSGWWMAMYYIVVAAQTAAVSSGMMAPPGRSNLVSIALALFNFAIVLYYLVELGVLKGTPGPNTYGPDPLGDKEGPYSQGDASF